LQLKNESTKPINTQEEIPPQTITNFQECVAAGNAILESYPEQCITQDGQKFINQTNIEPKPNTDNQNLTSCQISEDCIPLPSECHPTSCINKQFESNYKKPEVCTMMFMVEAAYSAQDCVCQQNICVNKNL
jgi:hypothetical protein